MSELSQSPTLSGTLAFEGEDVHIFMPTKRTRDVKLSK